MMSRSSETDQKEVCLRVGSEFVPALPDLKVGLAIASLENSPIYGVRIVPEGDTTGWYIWGGPYSTDPNFFEPVHTAHLGNLCPLVGKYLGLAPGFKFIVDAAGYDAEYGVRQRLLTVGAPVIFVHVESHAFGGGGRPSPEGRRGRDYH
jgi:hypothetical protein